MLYPQVPHQLKEKVATQFGFDIKVLSASHRREAEGEENRFTRLDVVAQFIRDFSRLGSLDQPDDYFEGTMSIGAAFFPHNAPMFVYFGGQTDRTHVGLWGSLKHVIGHSAAPSGQIYGSSVLDAMWHLIRDLDHDFQPSSPSESARLQQLALRARICIAENTKNGFSLLGEHWWALLHTVNSYTRREPQQRVEFMAKRLLECTVSGQTFVVGTPLYVALADSPDEPTGGSEGASNL
jgi:hypothetical protein